MRPLTRREFLRQAVLTGGGWTTITIGRTAGGMENAGSVRGSVPGTAASVRRSGSGYASPSAAHGKCTDSLLSSGGQWGQVTPKRASTLPEGPSKG